MRASVHSQPHSSSNLNLPSTGLRHPDILDVRIVSHTNIIKGKESGSLFVSLQSPRLHFRPVTNKLSSSSGNVINSHNGCVSQPRSSCTLLYQAYILGRDIAPLNLGPS